MAGARFMLDPPWRAPGLLRGERSHAVRNGGPCPSRRDGGGPRKAQGSIAARAARRAPSARGATGGADRGAPRWSRVSATAGAGKTTAVAAAARLLDLPVAWLTVDRTDAAPGRLVTYLEAALAERMPRVAGVVARALGRRDHARRGGGAARRGRRRRAHRRSCSTISSDWTTTGDAWAVHRVVPALRAAGDAHRADQPPRDAATRLSELR